jgi:signal transduction histidine kinase
MQAHPQSSPAARISLLSPSALASPPQPSHGSGETFSSPRQRLRPSPPALPPEALAHDARNLLNALGLYCELLKLPGVLQPEHVHYATELSLIASRSSELMLRLLESDGIVPTTVPGTDPAVVLLSYIPILQQLAGSSIKLNVTAAGFLPEMALPAEALERITLNLVLNAVQALQHTATAEIRVDLSMRSNKLQLTVEDNGPGLPPGLAAAFLRPTPLPPGATRGVGHRIIHEIAAATGGQLYIRVRPSNGTLFCVKWPVPAVSTSHGQDDVSASSRTGGRAA